MSETVSGDLMDLHKQPVLQEIEVRKGVVLRPLEDSDAAGLLAILDADPTIRSRVSVAANMHSEEDVHREVEDYQNDTGLIRYIIHNDGKCAGLVSFWRDDGFFGEEPKPNSYGFGYFLAPEERGKGLVKDSVQALMNAAQKNLHVDYFVAFCEDNNPESIAVLKRLGFSPTDLTVAEPTQGWKERKYEMAIKSNEPETIREETLLAHIPNMSETRAKKEGYRDYPIDKENPLFSEKLVDITDYGIAGQPYYSRPNAATGEAVEGVPKALMLRKSLAEKLADINQRLKNPEITDFFSGPVELYVEDAHRGYGLQKMLYEETFPELIRKQNPGTSHEKLAARLEELVAKPTIYEDHPAPHATGGAVDVILRYRQDTPGYVQGSEVPVGHTDGDTSRRVYPDYFEHGSPRDNEEREAQRNRRAFYAIMTGEAFGVDTDLQVNPTEWWHWSYGDQMWAKLSRQPAALYGLAEKP